MLNDTVAMFAQQVVEFGAQTLYYYIEWRLRYLEELVSHSGRKSAGSKSETWPKDILKKHLSHCQQQATWLCSGRACAKRLAGKYSTVPLLRSRRKTRPAPLT